MVNPRRGPQPLSSVNVTTSPRTHVFTVSRRGETMSSRRIVLKQSAAIGGALGLSPLGKFPLAAAEPAERRNPGRAPAPLNILLLGGTGGCFFGGSRSS